MTTFPRGRRPQLGFSSFADLTEVPVSGVTREGIAFDGDLSEVECAAVWARIESVDDADQAKRAELRTKRDAVLAEPTLVNLVALATANTNYFLGEAL